MHLFQHAATDMKDSAKISITQKPIHEYGRQTKEAGYFTPFTQLTLKDSGEPSEKMYDRSVRHKELTDNCTNNTGSLVRMLHIRGSHLPANPCDQWVAKEKLKQPKTTLVTNSEPVVKAPETYYLPDNLILKRNMSTYVEEGITGGGPKM